jgi:hypothetical protein
MEPRNRTIWVAVLWRCLLAAGAVVVLGVVESRLDPTWWLMAFIDFAVVFVVLFVLFYPLTTRERGALGNS